MLLSTEALKGLLFTWVISMVFTGLEIQTDILKSFINAFKNKPVNMFT